MSLYLYSSSDGNYEKKKHLLSFDLKQFKVLFYNACYYPRCGEATLDC